MKFKVDAVRFDKGIHDLLRIIVALHDMGRNLSKTEKVRLRKFEKLLLKIRQELLELLEENENGNNNK